MAMTTASSSTVTRSNAPTTRTRTGRPCSIAFDGSASRPSISTPLSRNDSSRPSLTVNSEKVSQKPSVQTSTAVSSPLTVNGSSGPWRLASRAEPNPNR